MKNKLYVFFLLVLFGCGDGTVSPSSSKCGCSKYNKADCRGRCSWTVGKGCGC
jgi:hypothetical protein